MLTSCEFQVDFSNIKNIHEWFGVRPTFLNRNRKFKNIKYLDVQKFKKYLKLFKSFLKREIHLWKLESKIEYKIWRDHLTIKFSYQRKLANAIIHFFYAFQKWHFLCGIFSFLIFYQMLNNLKDMLITTVGKILLFRFIFNISYASSCL